MSNATAIPAASPPCNAIDLDVISHVLSPGARPAHRVAGECAPLRASRRGSPQIQEPAESDSYCCSLSGAVARRGSTDNAPLGCDPHMNQQIRAHAELLQEPFL